ncbi:XRE family transcriptional regulator [Pelagerythrobacter marensis]|uniref:helix-turn-helix domain-containing protein n=1 Tax=Pelagerythrobacter marensis TaxID=543877 RepID=UPI0030840059
MARAALGWSTHKLAEMAGVGRATVVRFEEGEPVGPKTREKIEITLIDAGAQFLRRSGRLGVTVPE